MRFGDCGPGCESRIAREGDLGRFKIAAGRNEGLVGRTAAVDWLGLVPLPDGDALIAPCGTTLVRVPAGFRGQFTVRLHQVLNQRL